MRWDDIPFVGRFLYWFTYQLSKIFPSYAMALRWAYEMDRQINGPIPLKPIEEEAQQ